MRHVHTFTQLSKKRISWESGTYRSIYLVGVKIDMNPLNSTSTSACRGIQSAAPYVLLRCALLGVAWCAGDYNDVLILTERLFNDVSTA